MNSRRRLLSIFVALLFLAVSMGVIWAQDQDVQDQNVQDQSAQNQDMTPPPPPPNAQAPQGQGTPAQQQSEIPSRVARVQYMSGEVSTQPGGVNDWVAASLNRPLTTSDRIWTDKNSRAELNVGDGFIRMNSETSLTLTNVNEGTVQLELDQGTLELTVKHLSSGEIYEVDTPNFTFTVMKTGVYRFDVYPSQDQSVVIVRKGWGQASGHGQAVRVNSGTQIRFSNDQSMQHVAEAAPAADGFEEWAQVRDKRLDSSLSAQYVSPGVIGYQDLDAYGNWVGTGPYGNVWVPNSVPAGWAPYRYGHWVWVAPWGWTWVDDAPWGFAPFHYGRWVYWDDSWAWAPGPLGYWNPYYAPALVGWIGGPGFGIGFGWGGGWGFGIGIGFGWFPLGWGQPFYPHYCGWGYGGWYRGGGFVSGNYFRNVNITNTHIRNISRYNNNYFNNRGTNSFPRNGVTSASREAFTRGTAVNKVGGAVPASALNNAHALNRASINPTRESVLGGRTALAHGGPPASSANRNMANNARSGGMRPANVEAANRETMARENSPTTARPGGATTGNEGRQTAANNGRMNSSAANSESGRTGSTSRNNSPENLAGRTAHPGSTTGSSTANSAHNVPRPPASNNSFARANGAGATANRPTAGTGVRANNSTSPMANRSGANAARPSGSSSMASRSVPRPPAGYTYHPAPAYSANRGSSSYGANRGYSGYGGSRGTYGSQGYGSAGRSYGSGSTPSYGTHSYGSSPSYSARSYGSPYSRGYGSSPSYGSHSYGGYSAPHSSGGYSAPRSYGGGGSYHGGGGGGYHGGGGGGSHGGGGGGGGHHGR